MSIIEKIFEYPFLVRIFNNLLKNEDKLNLAVNRSMLQNSHKIQFYDYFEVNSEDESKWYYDSLRKIIIKDFVNSLPKYVTKVQCDNLNSIKDKNIPQSVKRFTISKLTFKNEFVPRSLNNVLFLIHGSTQISQHITHLIFRRSSIIINFPELPNSLIYLRFNNYSNQDMLNKIPESVKYLRFGYAFNQNIYNCIPKNVKILKFGRNFNHQIENCIPRSVRKLKFGVSFNKRIKGFLPEHLENLSLSSDFQHYEENFIPDSVICLSLGGYEVRTNFVPKTVTHLKFRNFFNYDIDGLIPEHVTHLEFGKYFNKSINGLIPKSVKSIRLGKNFDREIDDEIRKRVRIYKK